MHLCGKTLFLVLVMVLSGCQGVIKNQRVTVPPRAGVPVLSEKVSSAVVISPGAVKKQLSICLFEAEQLLKINKDNYRVAVNALYQNIREAKYYASIAPEMSSGSTDTLTPMYQFRVNDACNTISQLLLAELKKGDALPVGN